MRVFVVDDSPTAALHLRLKLQELGHDVVVAKHGVEAWEHLQSHHEPLVITDWMMPGMDGLELCRRIRSRGNHPYTYVILMTVKDLRKDRLDGLRAGADDFLTKPADLVELTAALETAKRILSVQFALETRVAELEAALADMKLRTEPIASI